jgi:hypothetical protein
MRKASRKTSKSKIRITGATMAVVGIAVLFGVFLFIGYVTLVPHVALEPYTAEAANPGWIIACDYSHSLNDDPIVFPGRPGVAHLHDFNGARSTNAFSTPQSLRAGGTACALAGDSSSYWVPATYEDSVRVLPNATTKDALFYYRRIAAPLGTVVQTIPDGLRIIVGNQYATSEASNPGIASGRIFFKCGPGSNPQFSKPPEQCSSGIMVISYTFPNCWNGKDLDSPDHFSHMAYPRGSSCPSTHPVVIPRVQSYFRYLVGTGPIGNITLASGPYYTAHQDLFSAWDPAALQALVTSCINAGRDCGTNPIP